MTTPSSDLQQARPHKPVLTLCGYVIITSQRGDDGQDKTNVQETRGLWRVLYVKHLIREILWYFRACFITLLMMKMKKGQWKSHKWKCLCFGSFITNKLEPTWWVLCVFLEGHGFSRRRSSLKVWLERVFKGQEFQVTIWTTSRESLNPVFLGCTSQI